MPARLYAHRDCDLEGSEQGKGDEHADRQAPVTTGCAPPHQPAHISSEFGRPGGRLAQPRQTSDDLSTLAVTLPSASTVKWAV
jgi:hypothetical protein